MCPDLPVRCLVIDFSHTVQPSSSAHNNPLDPSTHPHSGHVNERLCLSSALALYGPHQHVVSGSEDGGLCVWDLQSKRPLQRLSGHADALLALAKHPTEALLATGGTSKDCSIRLWRIRELAPSFAGEQEEEKEEEGGQQQEAAVAAPVAVESAVAEEAGGVAMDQSA